MRNPSSHALQPIDAPNVPTMYERAKLLIKEAHDLRDRGISHWHSLRVEAEAILPCLPRHWRLVIKLSISKLDCYSCPQCGQSMTESRRPGHNCPDGGVVIEQPTKPKRNPPTPAPKQHTQKPQFKHQTPPPRPFGASPTPKQRAGALLAQMEEHYAAGDVALARAANDLLNALQDEIEPGVWRCQIAPRIERVWCPDFNFA